MRGNLFSQIRRGADVQASELSRLQRKAIPLLSDCVLRLMVLMIRTAMHVEETSSSIVPDTWALCTISPPIFLSPMLRGDASRQALLCLGKSKSFVTRVGNPSCFMHINNLDEQKKIIMELNLKRTLTCIILTVLTTLTTRAQTLCVIDGIPLPDSLLHVTIDEMRSDSAKQIVSHRLGLIAPYAIETIQTFSADEQIKQAKNITFCKTPRDIVIIRTNSFAELQWVLNGKIIKPRKKLTIIDYKLTPQRIMEALPKGIKPTDIGSVNIITYINDPRQEKHPTIVIKTKTSNRLLNQRSLTEGK